MKMRGMLRMQQTEFHCTLVVRTPFGNVNRLPLSTVNCCGLSGQHV